MAFVIPVIAGAVGAFGGGALAAGALAGTAMAGNALLIGAAAGLGGALVSAAVTGGLDELFDDPEKLLTSMAMGAVMGGINGFKGAWDGLTKVDPASFGGKIIKGVDSAIQMVGNAYDSASDIITEGIGSLLDVNGTMDTAFNAFENTEYDFNLPDYGETLNASARADILTGQFGQPTMVGEVGADALSGEIGGGTQYEALVDQAENWGDGVYEPFTEAMGTEQTRMLREQEIFGDFAQTADDIEIEAIKAASPFDYAEEKASGFLDYTAERTGQALQQGLQPGELDRASKRKLNLPELEMPIKQPDWKIPSGPKTVQTLTGSMGAGSGTAGILSEDELYNNPVVQPLRRAMERQAQKAASLANRTWGLLQPTRQSGLMS